MKGNILFQKTFEEIQMGINLNKDIFYEKYFKINNFIINIVSYYAKYYLFDNFLLLIHDC